MRKLLLLFFAFCASYSFGQTYSYHFEGLLDAEKSTTIESQLLETKLFNEVKFRFKETKGEVWFTLAPPLTKTEGADPNYLSVAKAILIANDLQPIDLIELK